MLENINGIDDLKKLTTKELPALCKELREFLLPVVLKNGGHLASNLGAVELNVALHYVFGADDKIVWDVGHQSYVHKILTGRKDLFGTLRTDGGISGFPDTFESAADAFSTGHASTAISACCGLAAARDLSGKNYDVVAVVGDGALTGGLSYEGLNNISGRKMLIVFNDNGMSINKNVGSARSHMTRLRVGGYDKSKRKIKNFLAKIPLIGKPISRFLSAVKRGFKYIFLRSYNYFDTFDIKYVGPIDGNNIKKLVYYLSKIRKNIVDPTVLHIKTKKGYGFSAAETMPTLYHGVPANAEESPANMTQTAGETLCCLAEQNDKIVAITAAMTDGCGLGKFAERFGERFFDVGIAEEHAVTFAAGLAAGGNKPVFVVYSTFLQRGFDQILHDVCLQNLPVAFCIDRAGFVGADGKTHQGLFDLSYLTCLPNMTVFAPANSRQLAQMLRAATEMSSPVAVRYPKKATEDTEVLSIDGIMWQYIGKSAENAVVTLLACGPNMLHEAIKATRILSDKGIEARIVNACRVKPLDIEFLIQIKTTHIVTLEENVLAGGFGSAVTAFASANNLPVKVSCLGAPDGFVAHGTVAEQLESCGLSDGQIADFIYKLIIS